jgi:hypothetical protein
MTGGEISQIITASAALVAALGSVGGVFVSLRNGRKVDATIATVAVVAQKVGQVEAATNGLVAKLAAAKLAQGDAEGHARGLEEGRHP